MAGAPAQQGKSGWSEVGPKWITAIAGLITALAGAGFFVGRASATDPKPAPVMTTATVTVTAPALAPAPQGSTAAQAPTNHSVYFEGDLEFGEYNLDYRTPRPVAEQSIARYVTTNWLHVSGGKTRLVEWKTDSVPDKNQCGALVDEKGTNEANGLVATSRVCGRTDEGRIFRIDLKNVGVVIRSHVTVWDK
ncbi:hypothetical protein [Amycolatopsis sp. NPDC059021]|uniref:hypothetical protein n=1 Tax=Amycolatopsis sp. NPDC059021 TaxID=3346704 RepID=UPI0036735F0B